MWSLLQKRPNEIFRRSLNTLPYIIEGTYGTERIYDIYSRLLKERIVCLHSSIGEHQSSSIVAQLLYLDSIDAKAPIYLYINSSGGNVTDGLAIYDTMQYIRPPVHTVCMGMAASMASLLLTAGKKGERLALPNSRIMLHQPHGGARGQATDIAILAKEILNVREKICGIYAKHTSRDKEEIDKSIERDWYMTPEEAVQFGLIDRVISKKI
jgi:ATP-dependent Clp protease, protease subunit